MDILGKAKATLSNPTVKMAAGEAARTAAGIALATVVNLAIHLGVEAIKAAVSKKNGS